MTLLECDSFDLEIAKFMYRLKTQNLPLVFKDYYCSVTAVHRYRTRHASKNYFFHPRVNKARTQMSIKVRGAKLWNNLPVSLTENKIKLGKQCLYVSLKLQKNTFLVSYNFID